MVKPNWKSGAGGRGGLSVAEHQRGRVVSINDNQGEHRLCASHSPEVKARLFHMEIGEHQMANLKTSDECLNAR